MPAVLKPDEISLGGTRFHLLAPIQIVLASQFPGKTVIGDVGRDSNPNASALSLSTWQGGIGLYMQREGALTNRAWWSTCQLRYGQHLVLPALATLTAASGVSGVFTVGALGELNDEIYAAFGTSVRKYNNSTDSWGSSLHTLPAVATDAITVRMGGTVYLVFATSGGYTYTSDGVAFTDDTKDAKYLSFWHDKLWGIDNTGLLWYSSTIGTEVNDAQLPLPDGYVTDLSIFRDASGASVIYAATKLGLYAHDFTNTRFVETEVILPLHPTGGRGTAKWRDSLFYPAGLGIYRYINGSNSAVLTVMGPDRDDGLPSDKRGTIRQIVPTHNDILALTDATTAAVNDTLDLFDGSAMGSHVAAVIEPGQGFSSILGWDERGWETTWLSGSSALAITCGHVSNAYSVYRLWWGLGGRVYYMAIPSDIINPTEVTNFAYGASGELITPWFNADQLELEKLALRLKIDTLHLSANETVTVSYGLNLSVSWTSLGTITSDGVTSYQFPDSTTPTGTLFRWIRFKLELARGSTTTLSPHVHNLTLEYRKKLPAKWGFGAKIDLTQPYGGKSAKALRADLVSFISSSLLQEFTLRNDDDGSRVYYVDVVPQEGFEATGFDERGQVTILLVER